MELSVSKVGAEVGLTADTIRYYEKAGLLPDPDRTSSGYRVYDEDAIERLRFIKGVQRFGLRLREVRELLEVLDRGACPCGHAQALVERRLDEVDVEIAELSRVKEGLIRLAKELRSESQDPATGQWPCQSQFIEVGGR
jgi:DNA-binding transcriptional MerR regulator